MILFKRYMYVGLKRVGTSTLFLFTDVTCSKVTFLYAICLMNLQLEMMVWNDLMWIYLIDAFRHMSRIYSTRYMYFNFRLMNSNDMYYKRHHHYCLMQTWCLMWYARLTTPSCHINHLNFWNMSNSQKKFSLYYLRLQTFNGKRWSHLRPTLQHPILQMWHFLMPLGSACT